MRVLHVETAELGKILTALNLQPPRQAARREKGLFQFHDRLAIAVDLENHIGLGIKVRIHRRAK